MDSRHQLGQDAEQAVAHWYSHERGARLVARNFRCRMGEIDLIFEEGRELVFVEVRARTEGGWVKGVESVTFRKQRRLSNAASVFLSRYRGGARTLRFDIVAWDGLRWERIHNARFFE